MKRNWERNERSSHPVVVDCFVAKVQHALPLELGGNARTAAAAIVDIGNGVVADE